MEKVFTEVVTIKKDSLVFVDITGNIAIIHVKDEDQNVQVFMDLSTLTYLRGKILLSTKRRLTNISCRKWRTKQKALKVKK